MGLVGGTQLHAQDLLLAAASDLAPAIPAIALHLKQNQNLTLRASIGSSGQLARQIEQGAPFDLFLSADENFVQQIVRGGHGDATSVQFYALGRLALWSKSGKFRTLADLASPAVTRIAIANPAHAPYGRLAKEALERAGLWSQIEPKLVLSESVRQTMQFASTGNVDATLTSWTLVHNQGGILLPDSIRQAGVVIRGSRNAKAAATLLAFLKSSGGQRILGGHGLLPVEPSRQPLPQKLEDDDGNRKGGRADEQPKKAERLRPAKNRNKDQ